MCASSAVTVTLKGVPAPALLGAVTAKCVAAAALTAMLPLVPAIELVSVSLAVIVWAAAALVRVTLKVWTPLSLLMKV